jgi:hypothetical protein
MDSAPVTTTIKKKEDPGNGTCSGIIVFAILLASLGVVWYKRR